CVTSRRVSNASDQTPYPSGSLRSPAVPSPPCCAWGTNPTRQPGVGGLSRRGPQHPGGLLVNLDATGHQIGRRHVVGLLGGGDQLPGSCDQGLVTVGQVLHHLHRLGDALRLGNLAEGGELRVRRRGISAEGANALRDVVDGGGELLVLL